MLNEIKKWNRFFRQCLFYFKFILFNLLKSTPPYDKIFHKAIQVLGCCRVKFTIDKLKEASFCTIGTENCHGMMHHRSKGCRIRQARGRCSFSSPLLDTVVSAKMKILRLSLYGGLLLLGSLAVPKASRCRFWAAVGVEYKRQPGFFTAGTEVASLFGSFERKMHHIPAACFPLRFLTPSTWPAGAGSRCRGVVRGRQLSFRISFFGPEISRVTVFFFFVWATTSLVSC